MRSFLIVNKIYMVGWRAGNKNHSSCHSDKKLLLIRPYWFLIFISTLSKTENYSILALNIA